MTTCACGAVSFECEEGRVILQVEDTLAIATISQGGGFVKVEHLTCQSCMRKWPEEAPVGAG